MSGLVLRRREVALRPRARNRRPLRHRAGVARYDGGTVVAPGAV